MQLFHILLLEFYTACKQGHIDVLERFINEGIDVNVSSDGHTPVAIAAFNGQVEALKLLVNANADLTTDGWCVVHSAVKMVSNRSIWSFLEEF